MKYLSNEGTNGLITVVKHYPLDAAVIDDVDYYVGIKDGELVRILNTKNYTYDLKSGSSVNEINFNATSNFVMAITSDAKACLYDLWNEFIDDITVTLTSDYSINFYIEENHHTANYHIIIFPNSFTVDDTNNTLDGIDIEWK